MLKLDECKVTYLNISFLTHHSVFTARLVWAREVHVLRGWGPRMVTGHIQHTDRDSQKFALFLWR